MINIEWFYGVDEEEVSNKMLGFIEALALEPTDILTASHTITSTRAFNKQVSVMLFYTTNKRDALIKMVKDEIKK